jgi:hypothetical protein
VPTVGVAFVVVLRGAVQVESGTVARGSEAPSVVEIDASTRVRVMSEARVVLVPPR